MTEINPNNPLVQALHDQWSKLLAIVLDKYDLTEVQISAADIEHFSYRFGGETPVIAVEVKGAGKSEVITLKLVRESDAHRLAELDRIRRNEQNKVALNGSPVDPKAAGAPQPIDPATGMHKDYWILSDEERSKGFVRPVRLKYIHKKCGVVTNMNQKIAETYARDPKFYGSTFCCQCREHFPVGEFYWEGTFEIVGS